MADILSTAASHSIVCVKPRAMTPPIDVSRPETSFEDAQLPGCGRCCARAQAHSIPVRNHQSERGDAELSPSRTRNLANDKSTKSSKLVRLFNCCCETQTSRKTSGGLLCHCIQV